MKKHKIVGFVALSLIVGGLFTGYFNVSEKLAWRGSAGFMVPNQLCA